ncbi:MAG: hypothetical protein M1835_003336, partial [Candelina submexicana]
GMTKFSSRDDNNYDRLLGELQRWVKAQRRALPPEYYQMPALARELWYNPSLLSPTSTYSSPPSLPPRNSTSPYQYVQQHPRPPREPPSNPATQPAYSVVYPSIQQQAQTDYNPFLAAMGQANNGFQDSYQAFLQAFSKESSEKARRDMAAYITADTASRRGSNQPPVHHHQQQQQQPSNDSFMQALLESQAQYQTELTAEIRRQTEARRTGNQDPSSYSLQHRGYWP